LLTAVQYFNVYCAPLNYKLAERIIYFVDTTQQISGMRRWTDEINP